MGLELCLILMMYHAQQQAQVNLELDVCPILTQDVMVGQNNYTVVQEIPQAAPKCPN